MGVDSWASGVSGDWSVGADWSNGFSPSATDTATIGAGGSYVVTLFGSAAAAAVNLTASGAEFYNAGALALGGTLSLQAGTLALAYGSISGGTLAMRGGSFVASGGTLDGVAVQGTLDMSGLDATLFVRDGLLLNGAGGSGAGSVALTGAYASLDFIGRQVVGNAVVGIGASGSQPGQSGPATLGITHAANATVGATLTLGSLLWLRDVGGQAVVSVGSIGPVQGATLPDALINQGTITAGVAGGTLAIAGNGTFINQGTVAVSNGGFLSIGTAGFSNAGRVLVSNGTLALAGDFATSLLPSFGSVTLSQGVVAITGYADNTGALLTIGTGTRITNNLGQLSLAGTIANGTLVNVGSGLGFYSGTGVLDGVSYLGALAMTGVNAGVTLTDGTEISAQGGGAGSISISGAGASLFLRGSETLDNAAIALGAGGVAADIGTNDAFLASAATTATLGPNLLVQQSGALAALDANGSSPIPGFGLSDTLVNEGSVTAAVSGGQFVIGGFGSFINQGSIAVSNGDTLSVTVQQFANAGTLTVGAGGTAFLGSSGGYYGNVPVWSNAGLIAVNGGTLVLGGAFTAAQLGAVQVSGGGVAILAGTLTNAGATLTLGAGGTLPSLSLAGTIIGGAVVDAGGALSAGAAGNGVLDGVSYTGLLDLSDPGSVLRVHHGLSLTGTATITGAGSVLDFWGTQSFGRAQVALGAAGGVASIDIVHDYGVAGATILTFGTALSITQMGALAAIGRAGGVAGDGIVNTGTITGAVAGGTLSLGGPGFVNAGQISVSNGDTLAIQAAQFSNSGQIAVSNATLSIGGSVTLAGLGQLALNNASFVVGGTLDATGQTLSIGAGSSIGRLQLTGILRGGTIIDGGGGLAGAGGATLDGVTYQGVLDLSRPFTQIAVADGIVLTDQTGSNAGSIALTGAQTKLFTLTSETLGNCTITLGSPAQMYNGQHLAAPEIAAAAGTTLTIGARTTIRGGGTSGMLGDAAFGQWSDSIINMGQILSASALNTITLGSNSFINSGTIASLGGGLIAIADTGFLNNGLVSIGAGSALQIQLYDFYAAPLAGSAVLTNAGTIQIGGGILQEVTGNGLFPVVPIANQAGGLLKGYGLIFAPIANSGTIEASGGGLVLEAAVTGNGTLLIDPGATLEIPAAATAGEQIAFGSAGGTLRIDQPSLFAGTISNFLNGDIIDLPGQILTGVGLNSGTLVASTATQNYRIASSTPLAGELSAGRDIHGGATITITPQMPGGGGPPATIPVTQPGMLFWASPAGDVFQGLSANVTAAHISNWSSADSLDITDIAPAHATLAVTNSIGLTTLSITNPGHSVSVALTGTYTASGFLLAPDGHGGVAVIYST